MKGELIMKDVVRVLNVRNYKAGYQIRTEEVLTHFEDKPNDHSFIMKRAYTPEGLYIGDSKTAYRLCKKRGIKPELANEKHNICSIGFSEKEQKWYGWSHRAICGFGIGDEVKEGDCTNSSGWTPEYLKEHPEEDLSLPVGFKAKTLDDAKRMAIAFADSVG